MPHSSEIIISDTSCLILLHKIDELEILKSLSENVFITETIRKEFGKTLPAWIKIKSPLDTRESANFKVKTINRLSVYRDREAL